MIETEALNNKKTKKVQPRSDSWKCVMTEEGLSHFLPSLPSDSPSNQCSSSCQSSVDTDITRHSGYRVLRCGRREVIFIMILQICVCPVVAVADSRHTHTGIWQISESGLQYSTVQCCAVQYSAVQCSNAVFSPATE